MRKRRNGLVFSFDVKEKNEDECPTEIGRNGFRVFSLICIYADLSGSMSRGLAGLILAWRTNWDDRYTRELIST